MKNLIFIFFILWAGIVYSQKDTFYLNKNVVTLSEVVVGKNMDIPSFIKRLQEDTSFYKAFKNLRILGFSAINDIRMLDKNGKVKAYYHSKTNQVRKDSCRTMEILDEKTSGDFFDSNGGYNYYTANMYAGLFFTKGKICGETNIVGDVNFSTAGKSGIEKHKEQLKILFFNPGGKISGIPFMGKKTELYSETMAGNYDMNIDVELHNGKECFVFKQKVKEGKRSSVVINEMITWFDVKDFSITGRSYDLSYDAGLYDFKVSMEVEMENFEDLIVPKLIRYNGDWKVFGKKRERGIFTATLSGFTRSE